VRTIYADGGQNPEFTAQHLADVSRPEALTAPTDWVVGSDGSTSTSPVVKMAAKKARAKALAKAKPAAASVADRSDRTSTIKKPVRRRKVLTRPTLVPGLSGAENRAADRTCVAPSWMASSKSALMPIDNISMPLRAAIFGEQREMR
jgi:hypothetical protein